jgi:hypothetical protein
MNEPFCCLNTNCGCGQNEELHNEIHNVPFELNDEELVSFTKKYPYQYIQIHISCNCDEDGSICFCNDNRNLIRKAVFGEITKKRITELEQFKNDWFKEKEDYRMERGIYQR